MTGILVPPGDAGAIAAATVELLAQPDRAAAMGRAGREEVLAHWSIDRMVQGYEDLIAGIYRDKCVVSRSRLVERATACPRRRNARGSRAGTLGMCVGQEVQTVPAPHATALPASVETMPLGIPSRDGVDKRLPARAGSGTPGLFLSAARRYNQRDECNLSGD